jgi:hypothetical protein
LVQPGTLVVDVSDCRYSLTSLNVWIINNGFRPWMVGAIDRVRLTQTASGDYEVAANMITTAIPPASMGCSTVAFRRRRRKRLDSGRRTDIRWRQSDGRANDRWAEPGQAGHCRGRLCRQSGHSPPSPFSLDPVVAGFLAGGGDTTFHAYVDGPDHTYVILERIP